MDIHKEYSESRFRGRGSLIQVVKELERQRESKIDFIADPRTLGVSADGETLSLVPWTTSGGLAAASVGEYLAKPHRILDSTLAQIGAKVEPGVPIEFLKKFGAKWPEHAADFLTRLMHDTTTTGKGERRLVRLLDGDVRAYLSDRYRILDNYDLAFAALDVVRARGGEVFEASLSDTHMKLKFTTRHVWDAVESVRTSRGDWYAGGLGNQTYLASVGAKSWGELPGGPGTVHPIVTVSNSETGSGGLYVRMGVILGICFNIATIEEIAARIHVGERQEIGIFRPETQELEARVIIAKAQDAIRAAFEPETFRRIVARCRVAQTTEIASVSSAVENFVKVQGWSDERKESLLAFFVDDYDRTVWGFAQAVSRIAQDVVDPEDATSIEELAGKIIAEPEMVLVR